MKNGIILLGSSNSSGYTYQLSKLIADKFDYPIVDLKQYKILPFDYQFENQEDDFIKVFDEVLKYDHIVIATPVYWYSMSGIMKTFFDRLTDGLIIHKDKGRLLRGKTMSVISTGTDEKVVDYFFKPFKSSADYLGMRFKWCVYVSSKNGIKLTEEDIKDLK
ncbi:NAD(P)H-dependent oxidoreductase [Flammeovirga sp. MY04]|uniref:flavodoxin family protein n=1 Tax=Flammeovirga sp. MY04 TaxID=1191459 RepID=UPI0008063D55|nr:NAD(P)H-dependent oxidoreductase [Flammeovirga sp. MY04]ANQ49420.1 NAD(P)H-dependent oxidoreductase [Flammeovirga sp. MY04]